MARTADGEVLLRTNGLEIVRAGQGYPRVFELQLLGANDADIHEESATGGVANYYRGKDQSSWISGVPLYSRVRYREIYQGTDLVFHGSGSQLEYDFELAANSNANQIQMAFSDADKIDPETDGSLLVTMSGDKLRLLAPTAYQRYGDDVRAVSVTYKKLGSNRVGFSVGSYDHGRQLIIDPVVAYSSILSSANASVTAIAVDALGDLTMAGTTNVSTYPVVNGLPSSTSGSQQVVVTKMDPSGSSILYSTYLPASGFNAPNAITVDSSGNAYVAGSTGASDFPLTSTNLGTCGSSCYAGFVTKLDSTGAIVYSTLLASGEIIPKAIAVDAGGNALVAGLGGDASLQTVSAYQPVNSGGASAFFGELNPTGTGYVFSSYLGTGGIATGIAFDASGDLYVAGSFNNVFGTAIPLKGELQSQGGLFLTKFTSDGRTLLFGSYLGGTPQPSSSVTESVAGLGVAADGTVYLGGYTSSFDFPYTINAYRHPTSAAGSEHMFAMALNPSLSSLKYSTYLGEGFMNAMAVDQAGNLYAAGVTSNDPVRPQAAVVADQRSGGEFLELDPTGTPVQISGFGGESVGEPPSALAIDKSGNLYLSGNPSYFNLFQSLGCSAPDPVLVGGSAYAAQVSNFVSTQPGFGGPCGSGIFFAKIALDPQPQISLGYVLPFLPLHNVGSADLHISSIAFSGNLAKAQDTCGATVPAGTSCVLTLTDLNGAVASGSVIITSDASPSVQTFTPYVDPKSIGTPVLDFPWADTSQLTFPPQQMGTIGPTRSLRLFNAGLADLTLQSISGQGAIQQTHDCISRLAPGAYCTIQVVWKANNGYAFGSISINYDNGYNYTYTIPSYFITSPTPLLVSSNGNLSFGTQTVGSPSLYRTLTVTNVSGAQVSTPVITLSGSNTFSIVGNTCTSGLAPEQSCIVAVLFSPVANGPSSGTLDVNGGTPSSVALDGTGVLGSVVTVTPLELQWMNVIVGLGFSQDLTLTNTSTSTIPIVSITFTQPDYSETDNCAGALAGGASCIVHVNFNPQATGTENGSMTIDFGGKALAQVLSLTANTIYVLNFAPSSLDFGSNNPAGGPGLAQPVVLSNNSYPARAYTLSITGPFSFKNNCANPLPAFYGCSVSVNFNPTSPGLATGTLSVQVAGFAGSGDVSLSGSAYAAAPPPVLSPSSGTYPTPTTVTITDSAAGAVIYYTTDGSAPTTSSLIYTSPLTVRSTETISAIAVAAPLLPSAIAAATYTITQGGLQFVPVTPCRIADTRGQTGAFGGPGLGGGTSREFDVPQSVCGIPAAAVAYSLNVTVVPNGALNYLTIWPTGLTQPFVSTLNSDGRVKANAAIVPAGNNGGVNVFVSDTAHVILDINGYFVPTGTPSALAFFPVTPCRVADTRAATGVLGGPFIVSNTHRDFPVRSSSCGVPSTAQAYSLNVTAVPHSTLNYLTAWSTGQNQPYVSTLNSLTGAVTANAAIVPTASNGDISIFVSDDADVILDVNGYFAAPATGSLALYTVAPCRVTDTRSTVGSFNGVLPVQVQGSTCAPPSTAQAYVLNGTVVPSGPLNYLTLWPDGQAQPYVSTLNALDAAIISNMAIVPTTNGLIDAFSSDHTDLIVDLSSYFGP